VKWIAMAVVVSAMVLGSCARCKHLAMRCSGLRVELCDARGRWRPVMDCGQLGEAAEPSARGSARGKAGEQGAWACCCERTLKRKPPVACGCQRKGAEVGHAR